MNNYNWKLTNLNHSIPLLLRLWWPVLESIQHVVLKQLLVADTDFHRLARWTMLPIPRLDKRNVDGSPGATRPHVEGSRCPKQGNAIGCVVCEERGFLHERLHKLWQLKLLVVVRQRLDYLKFSTM